MDAVQQANSGHPGTPMAMAPVVYNLWQNHLRFDPQDPIWPNRDRFVLSMGHASTLLYSMLCLAEVQAVDTKYEVLGRPSVTVDDIKRFRQIDSRCPGHPEYRFTSGVETTTGPLGQGVATSVGMAMGERLLAQLLQPAALHHVRPPHLRAVRRRLHDGRRLVRGGLARRPPQALQALLDLRFQPHHHRGPHRPRLHRGRGRAVRGVRLARRAGAGRERPEGAYRRVRPVLDHHQQADPDHRRKPYRLRRAAQAGHLGRARRATGRGGDPPRQARLWLARGRQVPGARRGGRAYPRRARPARRRGLGRVEGAVRRLQEGIPEARRPSRAACSGASCPTAGTRT